MTDFVTFIEKMPEAKKVENYDPLLTKLDESIVVQERLKPIQEAIEQVVMQIVKIHGEDWVRKVEEAVGEYSGKRLPCDTVFALFATYCVKFVSAKFYSELILFLTLYREALNKRGWEFHHRRSQLNPKCAADEVYTASQTAEFAPELSNPFITEYFPAMAKAGGAVISPDSLSYLGMDDKKLCWMILLIKNFCSWLYINKFSEGKVEVTKGTA